MTFDNVKALITSRVSQDDICEHHASRVGFSLNTSQFTMCEGCHCDQAVDEMADSVFDSMETLGISFEEACDVHGYTLED